jgi:hypothetical protein
MRLFRKSAAALALLATSSMLQAQAKAQACLTEPEATALFEYALPELLDSVAKRCAPTLPKQAFLATQAPQYVNRYRAASLVNWPLAKAAFIKSAGSDDKADKILAAVPDDALKSLLSAGLGAALAGDIKPATCPRVDKLVAALAPLPSSNVAQIIVQIMAMEGDKPGKSGDFRICQG